MQQSYPSLPTITLPIFLPLLHLPPIRLTLLSHTPFLLTIYNGSTACLRGRSERVRTLERGDLRFEFNVCDCVVLEEDSLLG